LSWVRAYVLEGGAVLRHKEWLLFTSETLSAACQGLEAPAAARVLADQGCLHHEPQKLTSRHTVAGGERQAYYAVIAKRLLPAAASRALREDAGEPGEPGER
jgi:hypothetical protein